MTVNLKKRLIAGSLAFVILTLSISFSYHPFFSPIFALINAAIISLALTEYYQLAKQKDFRPLTALGTLAAICYTFAVYAKLHRPSLDFLPSFVLLISLVIFFLAFFRPKEENSIGNLAVTVFGIVYLAIPLCYALKLNYLQEDGRLWLAYVIAVTKVTDTGAYFIGKGWGRFKLAPRISPKKTIEGAMGGFAAALLTSVVFYLFFIDMTFWQSIWFSILIAALAQIGDLAESILKRDAKVKDSSSHLPGLGGVLDIVDSLVFTLPLMYLILLSIGNRP